MITAMVTVFSLLFLLFAAGIKLWNLWHKAKKYPWWVGLLIWGFAGITFIALLMVMSLFRDLATIDVLYRADLQEAVFYVQFGMMMIGIISMLSLAEGAYSIGFLATEGFGVPSERRGSKRDNF